MRIYFNEYNLNMGNTVYFPLASGMLRAYAETFQEIREKYEFMPFLFNIDAPENIITQYHNPSIAAFSVSLWNFNLSLEVAKRLKTLYPKCLIVFGGPSAPKDVYPPIDIIMHGEGESQFASLLLGRTVEKQQDLSNYPSPYTAGLFDYLLEDEVNYQAIIETNRGCPNFCSYCYWGHGGLDKKYRFFSLDYIKGVAEWIGRNKIQYIFCADSNFGIFPRDVEIAKIFSDTKVRYSYPEKFRVCFGKQDSESIFLSALTLHNAGLDKSVTLSRQSTNQKVLNNINRQNIKDSIFDALQKRYFDAGISTYSELILGLPGETFESFIDGVFKALKYSENNNLFIYHCVVLPNTQLADKDYQERFGIKTVRIPITETHCEARPDNFITEYEDVVIETNTMSKEEWILLAVFSWEVQLKNSLGHRGEIPKEISQMFLDIALGITKGKPRNRVFPKVGNTYWEPEEYAFLLLQKDVQFTDKKILFGRKGKHERQTIQKI